MSNEPIRDPRNVDRALFSVLDSIEVRSGHVRFRKERSGLRRLLDIVTGREAALTQVLDEQANVSIEALLTLLNDVNGRLQMSDLTMVRMIDKLKLIAREAQTTAKQLGEVMAQVDQLSEKVEIVSQRVDAILETQHLVLQFKKSLRRRPLTLPALWDLLDALWWGPYGLVQRHQAGTPAADHLRGWLKLSLDEIIADALDEHSAFPLQPMLERIPALEAEESEAMGLLALDPDWRSRPLTRSLLERSRGETDLEQEALALPVLTTAERLGERLLEEVERGARP